MVLARLVCMFLLCLLTICGLLLLTELLGREVMATIALIYLPFCVKNKTWKWIYILYRTMPRDILLTWRYFKLKSYTNQIARDRASLGLLFQQTVKKHPNKVMIQSEGRAWTYHEVEHYTNRIANYFKSQGLSRGDSIALFMESRAEYMFVWLAIGKLGAITSLINSNQTMASLTHSLNLTKPKAIIFSSKLSQIFNDVRSQVPCKKLYQFNSTPDASLLEGAVDLLKALEKTSSESPDDDIKKVTHSDRILCIYTSGTTGQPKASSLTHHKITLYTGMFHYMLGLTDDDILYNALPLYHVAGSAIGFGQSILFGNTVCYRTKFSASNFWKDCVKYNCTVAQYIGEICRYLLAVPPGDPAEKTHKIRCMFGNGINPKIWETFMERFGIKQFAETYGATEGICNMVNYDGQVGAVGAVPRLLERFYHKFLVRYDEATEEPIRDANGLCIRCEPNEPGILVGKIGEQIDDLFLGYTNAQENAKKLLSNVVEKGDVFFTSDDVLVMDEFGYYYFRARLGDSFRWRGENVANREVEAVLSNLLHMRDVIVYGVEVPNADGRCGMAAIINDENNPIDLESLSVNLQKNLPSYAIPLFINMIKKVSVTDTYKFQKSRLQSIGFDINKTTDNIFFYDSKLKKYIPLDQELYEKILTGKVRL